jgi:hypothetical protein
MAGIRLDQVPEALVVRGERLEGTHAERLCARGGRAGFFGKELATHPPKRERSRFHHAPAP